MILLINLPTGYFVHYFNTQAGYLKEVCNYPRADLLIIDIKTVRHLPFAMIRNKVKDVKYLFIINEMPISADNVQYYIMRDQRARS